MSVRAKFVVQNVTPQGSGKQIKLAAQYDTSIPEDQRFSTATPWGELTMLVDNPKAADQFEIGKAYYLDFSKAA